MSHCLPQDLVSGITSENEFIEVSEEMNELIGLRDVNVKEGMKVHAETFLCARQTGNFG